MPPTPVPSPETQRLEILERYDVLDTAPETAFDELTALAAEICDAPVAVISLLDGGRAWFKSSIGFELKEVARESSFCTHAIKQRELFLVPDATRDSRFASNPLVTGEPYVRCYAGMPLVAPEGQVLGALCVIDYRPRELNKRQQRGLRVLGQQVVAQLELRRRARESLAGESRLRNILNSMFAYVGVFSLDGRMIEANDAPLAAAGLRREDVIGQPFAETYWWSHSAQTQAQVCEALHRAAQGGTVREDFVVRVSEGQTGILDGTFGPLRDAAGRITEVVGSATDVTKERQAQAALEQSETRFRQVVENIREVFWMVDVKRSQMLYISPAYEQIWGRSCESLYASPGDWIEAVHPEDRGWVETALAGQVAGSYDVVYRIVRPAGDVRWVRDRAFPVRNARGDIYRLAGVAEDITERQQAEEALRLSEAQFRATFEGAAIGIALVDPAGRPMKCNRALAGMLGYAPEELASLSFSEFTHPDDLGADLQLYQSLLAGEREHYELEKRYFRKDGQIVSGRLTVSLVRQSGGTAPLAIAMVENITERRKLEEQFLRAQRMESIGTLAGGIAHDLNNVLGPIVLSLDLLRLKFPDPGSEELLSTLACCAQRGAAMVHQVLSFARGVGGQRVELQIKHVIRDIEKIANDTFLKHIQVRTMIPPDLWTVQGDPTQLHQVLLNLCVNARDAMPEGGTLTLSAENLAFDAHYVALESEAKPGPYVLLEVEDSGMGMPPEIIEKIFDPFFTTKELGKGTGLGLSTTLAIVKSHGGFIRVYSELGSGTKFRVYLPAQTEASQETVAAAEAEMPRGHGEVILVVDDEPSVQQITQQTLEAFGYRVLLATDGADAVAIYARQREEIAAVLTDMMMPIMDGPATIQALRRLNLHLPIIAASGLAANSHVSQVASLGVKHFLPKPYTAETLLKILRQIFAEEL